MTIPVSVFAGLGASTAVAEELADVPIRLPSTNVACAIDHDQAIQAKLHLNEVRFPNQDGTT